MNAVSLRFYASLNDFLESGVRGRRFRHEVFGQPAVKDVIESLGVPHPEVALILINGCPGGFERAVAEGDRISVYPAFCSIELTESVRLQPEPLTEPRFVLDVHLGRLARYLRMLGFDCLYANDFEDRQLADLSRSEDRILLSRDRELLKRGQVQRGYYLRSTQPREQVVEVVHRFQLEDAIGPFERCMSCNGRLEAFDAERSAEQIPPAARRQYDEFRRCRDCHRVYWAGSHVERMETLIEWIRSRVRPPSSG